MWGFRCVCLYSTSKFLERVIGGPRDLICCWLSGPPGTSLSSVCVKHGLVLSDWGARWLFHVCGECTDPRLYHYPFPLPRLSFFKFSPLFYLQSLWSGTALPHNPLNYCQPVACLYCVAKKAVTHKDRERERAREVTDGVVGRLKRPDQRRESKKRGKGI